MYKSEKEHMKIPLEYKRNTKLFTEDKDEIRKLYAMGTFSHRELAEMYNVSKKTIYYILHPDKYQENLKYSVKYNREHYDKDIHREYMRTTRKYRKELEKQNILIKEN